MQISASIENWYIKSVYLEYLSSQTDNPLSHDTILVVTADDEQHRHSITATDIKTGQCMTIDNDGLVKRYKLYKVA